MTRYQHSLFMTSQVHSLSITRFHSSIHSNMRALLFECSFQFQGERERERQWVAKWIVDRERKKRKSIPCLEPRPCNLFWSMPFHSNNILLFWGPFYIYTLSLARDSWHRYACRWMLCYIAVVERECVSNICCFLPFSFLFFFSLHKQEPRSEGKKLNFHELFIIEREMKRTFTHSLTYLWILNSTVYRERNYIVI